MLSVIIPSLNAEKGLVRTLEQLVPGALEGLVRELIVVDGGSQDATLRIADDSGATIIFCKPGRGGQLKSGAAAAQFDWLLFLHADTALDDGWLREVAQFVTAAPCRAGVFRFALDDDSARARIMELLVRIRCAVFALPYGDQGLLISRSLYEEVGGFNDIPLMEDVDIVRRIGRRRLTFLQTRAVTSAVRYQQYGYILRAARNLACLALFFLRVPPRILIRLYG